MSIGELMSAAMFAVVTSITPGPNNAMLMASGLNFGFARTLPHMIGISLGFPIMLLAVGLGFGQLFEMLPVLHRILEILGTAYLLYLAWQIARAGAPEIEGGNATRPMTLFEAAAFQWVNPKAWIIATGAVAVLLKPESFALGFVALAVLYGVVSFPCIALWAAGGSVVGRALKRPWQHRLFNVSMAALLTMSVLLPLFIGAAHTRS
jgi:threonine/homoserine/homoserine lactone efflux protein